jgi:uncharacterized lipoprotein YddW (UPF0748 family)
VKKEGWKMKNRIIYIFILIIMILSSFISQIQGDSGYNDDLIEPSPQPVMEDTGGQYRSMWLEGYQIVNRSEVIAVVEYARKFHFNCLSPLINGDSRGVFYNSSRFPKHPDVKWDFDPLMDLIRESHKYGIQVHPWWHTMIDPYFIYDHPEWGCVSSGGSTSGYWINPAYEEARSYIRNSTMEVVRNYPIDGIKLDTIRYPNSAYSFDDYSIEKFNRSGLSDYDAFRRLQITETVELIYDSIMEEKPWIWVGADIFSNSWSRMTGVFQEPELWSSRGIMDYVTPMLYTTSLSSFTTNLQNDIAEISCHVVAGTYIYIPGNTAHGSVPNETVGIELMLDQVNTAISSGAWGICGFAYKFLREYPSYGRALRDGPFSNETNCPVKNTNIPVNRSRWDFDKDHDREGWLLQDSGYFYPDGGVWSITGSREPKLISPRLNISAEDINVIEISLLLEEGVNCTIEIFWGHIKPVLDPYRSIKKEINGTGEWKLHSLHLDQKQRWEGLISYFIIVAQFGERANLTLDLVSLHWMPYCIKEFSYLGPFTAGGNEDLLDREFIENEGSVMPGLNENTGGREWKALSLERDLVDFRLIFGKVSYNVVYAHVFVQSEMNRTLVLKAGSSDGIKCWLNGDLQIVSREPRSISPDQNEIQVRINKGINSLLVKLAGYTNEFSFFLRFATLQNSSVEGLDYYSTIPEIEGPIFNIINGSWLISSDVHLSWDVPESITDISHFQYTLDGGKIRNISSSDLYFEDLEDGFHEVSISAVDALGFKGKESQVLFGVDTVIPRLNGPFIERSHTNKNEIYWNWSLIEEPTSDIDHYECIVSYGDPGGSFFTSMETHHTVENDFTLTENIVDGFVYYLKVRSISQSGRYYISPTSEPVIVDHSAPPPPSNIVPEITDRDNMTYIIQWDEIEDNVRDGMNSYEILIDNGTGEFFSYQETKSNLFSFNRRFGTNPLFKIRSVDKAGNLGRYSKIFDLELKGPVANIVIQDDPEAGKIIEISSEGSFDEDGKITGYLWKLDEIEISTDSYLKTTFEKGVYNILLTIWDDTGFKDTEEIILVVDESSEGSLRSWIIDGSMKDDFLPIINITVPVYNDEVEEKENPLLDTRNDVVNIFLIVFSSFFIISILVYFSFLYKRMRIENVQSTENSMDETTDDWGGPPDWRKIAENGLRAKNPYLSKNNNPFQPTMSLKAAPEFSNFNPIQSPSREDAEEIDFIVEDGNEISLDEVDEFEELSIDDWDIVDEFEETGGDI